MLIASSEIAKHSSEILAELIPKYLDKDSFKVLLGDKEIVAQLLEHRLGHIAYIGGAKVGKIIAAAAAKNLTPITLELGGKNPIIVSDKANIALAAKRIMWAKHFTAGQICVAPDYALVHESVKEEFLAAIIKVSAENFNSLETSIENDQGTRNQLWTRDPQEHEPHHQ